jgi:UV DNA damage endonuclease
MTTPRPAGGVPYRLGFAVKVLGDGGIPSADTRRWQSGPHLRRSIDLLGRVLDHIERIGVSMYRLSSQVIPYGTHPDLPQLDYRRQLEEASEELDALGDRTQRAGLRLSTHPGQYTVLNATDSVIVDKAIADLEQDAALLDRLGQGPEGSVVVHVGGEYGDRTAALDRWVAGWERLSPAAQARLTLENDEHVFGLDDVLELHRRTGVRVVLDVHHHRINRRTVGWPLADALAAAYRTWPPGVRPKVHLSSARTMLERTGTGKATRIAAPPLRAHADLVLPWDLEAVVTQAPGPLDVMLEAKGKDLALVALRRVLTEVAPSIAALEERDGPGAQPGSVGRPPRGQAST